MRKHNFVVTIDNKEVFSKEGETYPIYKEARQTIESELWQVLHKQYGANVGDKDSIRISMSVMCTMNGRAPRRPADVIAAEKQRCEDKRQARQAREDAHEKGRALAILRTRKRIQHQVDHAFALGKRGTEPAAKYITCECNAPADYVLLNHALTRGVTVLDEDLIDGAVCEEHKLGYGGRSKDKVPCSRLEFFYDGVRQIAIKS